MTLIFTRHKISYLRIIREQIMKGMAKVCVRMITTNMWDLGLNDTGGEWKSLAKLKSLSFINIVLRLSNVFHHKCWPIRSPFLSVCVSVSTLLIGSKPCLYIYDTLPDVFGREQKNWICNMHFRERNEPRNKTARKTVIRIDFIACNDIPCDRSLEPVATPDPCHGTKQPNGNR